MSRSLSRAYRKSPSYAARGGAEGVQVKHPERYYRQYLGIIVHGRKIIYINAFCEKPLDFWQERFYEVCDGGGCFWGVEYDVDSGRFSNLQMNGVG
jgi:hypothetical protein